MGSGVTPLSTVAYDANGNTLTDPSGKSYSWDFENRLVSATNPGVGTTTFKYDPFGRRIYKQSPSFTSVFVYDRANLIETLNASGAEVASYARTQQVDETLGGLRSGTTDYYEADGVESTTSLRRVVHLSSFSYGGWQAFDLACPLSRNGKRRRIRWVGHPSRKYTGRARLGASAIARMLFCFWNQTMRSPLTTRSLWRRAKVSRSSGQGIIRLWQTTLLGRRSISQILPRRKAFRKVLSRLPRPTSRLLHRETPNRN